MTSIIGSVTAAGGQQRRQNKDKKSQSNKSNHVVNSTASNDNNQSNHTSDKQKVDHKLQPTAEQIRIANLMNDKMDDNDIKAKIDQIVELTGASRDDAVVALHDCDNDVSKAVDMILEGDSLDTEWRSTGKKKKPPKSAANSANDENHKPDHSRDNKSDNRDAKQSNNRSESKSNRVGGGRGGGPPRLQKALAFKGQRGRPGFKENRNSGDRQPSDDQSIGVFNSSQQPTNRSLSDMSAPPKRNERRGRGRGSGRGGGNRGAFSGSGRGSRTFQNRGLQGNDGFPNSIDTWTNSTADETSNKANLTVNTMTVGNWSDIATNEDWSEEDWDPNHMETKVFTPSTKISEKEEIEVRDKMSSKLSQNNQNPNLTQFMPKSSVDSNQQSMSSLLSANISRNANVAAGQTLLQQIQQSNAGQTSSLNQFSHYNKQATESIKSLVGLTSSSNYNNNNSDLLSTNERDLDSLTNPQNISMTNKTARIKQTRPSKIPESAVEMPSNDTIAALGVHFGSLEFGSDSNQFSLSSDTNAVFQEAVSHVNKQKKSETNSLSSSSILTQSTDNTYRPSNTNINDSANKVVSSSIIQNSVLGHQSLTGDTLLDHNKSSVGQYAHKVLDRTNKSDYSSVSPQQTVSSTDITSNYKTTYSSDNTYNSSYSTTSSSTYPYTNSQSYGNYSTNFSGTAIGNTSNSSNQKLRDMDTNPQQKQYDVTNNSVGSLGMINSTVTTNVLKNTLSATGKGVHNVPPGVAATPVLSTPYIVQNTGVPIYPMGIPYDLQFQPTAREHNFGPYGTQDVKYGRGSENEVIPVSTSQTGVSHNQTFVNTFPPGYGFYLAPGINMMPAQSIYPTAGPLYPVAQHQGTGSGGNAFAKASTTYGSHSYNSGYDSISGVAQNQDYVKQSYPQSVQQHNKGMSGSNASDLTSGNTSIYGKSHSQINKSYDKQGFQTATPAFNLTAGTQSAGNMSSTYGAPYVLPHSQQAMSLHTMSSLQNDVSQTSGPGVAGQRSISQSHKNSGTGANNYKYNWS
ncbi:ubiquitin-associated protein 2-like [Oppia nitens]|uniref:ubiquitin-associated protein 2-like n=1 Tax=Oppia nitens TaxID=1686743 RepID=UPI0023DB6C85|nr:ubiquitin-associated protein 2-like [Oppia nitens]XP_054160331.1 ubiquitin-associated protein 2-like [Oppia nitens]